MGDAVGELLHLVNGGLQRGRALGNQFFEIFIVAGEGGAGAFKLGDIAGDFGSAKDLARIIAHRGERKGDIQKSAVLAAPGGFVMFNALASSQPGEDHRFLVLQIVRDQDGNRLSDHFSGRIAKDTFSALIPGGDNTIERFGDNGIV